MKYASKFAALLLSGALLSLPAAAMESRVTTVPLFPKLTASFSVEQLEAKMELEEGDLLALTFLRLPENGQLVVGGVPVERGETLLRRELEQLHYIAAEEGDDWFAVLPSCSQKICVVFNLKSVL